MKSNVFVLLAALGLILRIVFSFLIPNFTGNDEPAHLRYAQHILREWQLPDLNNYQENPAGNEYFQPPLYYIIGAIFISVSDSQTGQLRILRTISILYWAIGFYFAYKLLNLLKLPGWLSLSTMAFFALLPTYIANSSTINNDSLIVPLTIIAIYYTVKFSSAHITYPQILVLSALSGIAVLTKLNGLVLVPTVFAALYGTYNKNSHKLFLKSLLYFVLTITICSWWFVYNKQIYNDWLGPISASTNTFEKIPFSLQKIYLLSRGTFATFWVAYGPANNIRLPTFIYGLLLLISTISVIGIVTYTQRILKGRVKLPFNASAVKILLVALAANLFLHIAFNINYHQPLGRYLYISLIQIAIVFSLGISTFLTKKTRAQLPYFLIGLFLFLNSWAILKLVEFY